VLLCCFLLAIAPSHVACSAMGRRPGDKCFSIEIKEEICQKVRHTAPPEWRLKFEKASKAERSSMFRKGRGGDPLLTQAFDNFKATTFRSKGLKDEQKRIDRRAFSKIVTKWLPRFFGHRDDLRCRRQRKEAMTAAEAEEAARILATPKRRDGSIRYYRSVRDAIDESPHGQRLQTLLNRSGLSERAFHKRVLNACPNIVGWGRLDLRDQLPATTLEGRRHCSDIWSGRVPWLTCEGKRMRLFDADMDDVDNPGRGKRYVYWNNIGWDIFKFFTFIVDATTVDNTKGQAQMKVSGFVPVNIAYPPEDVPAAAAKTTSNKVMFYCWIHNFIGLVGGPHIIHGGSSATYHGRGKEQRHSAEFPTWCARTHAFACQRSSLWCRVLRMRLLPLQTSPMTSCMHALAFNAEDCVQAERAEKNQGVAATAGRARVQLQAGQPRQLPGVHHTTDLHSTCTQHHGNTQCCNAAGSNAAYDLVYIGCTAPCTQKATIT